MEKQTAHKGQHRIWKRILRIFLILTGISVTTFFIDGFLADQSLPPLFSIHYAQANDGGSSFYLGLGYQIIRWHILSGEQGGYEVGVEKHYLIGIDLAISGPNVELHHEEQ